MEMYKNLPDNISEENMKLLSLYVPHLKWENDCLIWNGWMTSNCPRYEVKKPKRKVHNVSKVIYTIYYSGEAEPEVVTQVCNNIRCVNYQHMKPITYGMLRKRQKLGLSRTEEISDYEINKREKLQYLLKSGGRDLETRCLLAKQKPNEGGYVFTAFMKKSISIHNLMWILYDKEIPEGQIIRHKCPNKNCYEMTHLEAGTYRQNGLDDKIRDGTLLRGSTHPNAKITDEVAQQIKDSIGNGTRPERAKRFNVSKSLVNVIDRCEAWGHLPLGGEPDPRLELVREKQFIHKKLLTFGKDDYVKTWRMIIKKSTTCEATNCIYTSAGGMQNGVPVVHMKSKRWQIKQLSWEMHHNNFVKFVRKGGKQVIVHKCGNNLCVNPDHLYLGTMKDVCRETRKWKKGKGIDEQTAKQIWDLKDTIPKGEIAKKYQVSTSIVRNIHSKKTHLYLHDERPTEDTK